MQVFYSKLPFLMRYLSAALVFCLVFSLVAVPVGAVEIPDYGENWEDVWTTVDSFYEFVGGALSAGLTDLLWFPWGSNGELFYLDSFMSSSLWSCPEHAAAVGADYHTHFFPSHTSRLRNCVCAYCGLLLGDLLDSFEITYDDYVSDLAGVVELPLSLSDSCVNAIDTALSDGSLLSCTIGPGSADFEIGVGTRSKTSSASGSTYFYLYQPRGATFGSWLTDTFTVPADGTYTITFPASSSIGIRLPTYYVEKYYNGSWESVGYVFSDYFYADSGGLIQECSVESSSYTLALVAGMEYRVRVSYDYEYALCSNEHGAYYYSGVSGYIRFADSVHVVSSNGFGTVFDPSDPNQAEDEKYSEDTRVALLMELLQQYNEKMDFQANSDVMNYFIGQLNDDGTLSGYYSPHVFDEQSKVFTEPVTGAQYLAKNWTYNYESRAYGIALEPGTMYIGDTEIPTIVLQYGDDAVTIYYVDAAENIVQTDEYAYVMVASNECALNGHAYNVDTTLEPSCTRVGERTYTCSVCGDQYVENIPLLEHSYTFTVIREPSCSSPGMGTYACSACGMQYTESIPALEHTGVLLEVVDTVYGESGAVITAGYSVYECSTCGTHYVEYDDVGSGTGSGFWSSLVDSFASALSSAIDAILGLIIYVLETVLGLIKDLLSFLYSFITDTVLGGISNMFAAFSDGSLFEFFQTEDGGVALPGDVSIVFGFFSGVIMALPLELRAILFFAIAAGVLIAIFKVS